ncbi:proteasome subunit beta type-7-A-like [Setaria viridis]|uniref:proteasome subunit beta type-7-A-like n=1 Tax=Setaria viridis TaxID=4556 RepID=UPI003B3AD437
MDVPAKGGFSFDLCLRNGMLEKEGLKGPGFRKTGTTIVGLVFADGVVLGADTRATEGPIVADKNWSLAAMSVSESKYKEGLTREEGIQLVSEAIRAGIYNDLGSGSNVDVCVITEGKTEYLRNHELPNPRTYVSSKGYSFVQGQTEVLSTKITPLKPKGEVTAGDAMEE